MHFVKQLSIQAVHLLSCQGFMWTRTLNEHIHTRCVNILYDCVLQSLYLLLLPGAMNIFSLMSNVAKNNMF